MQFLTIILFVAIFSVPGWSEDNKRAFSYDDVKALKDVDATVWDWSADKRIAWIKEQIDIAANNEIERYRYQRMLSGSLFFSGDAEASKSICLGVPPFKDDFYYRSWCVEANHTDHQSYIESKLEIAMDAETAERFNVAVEILLDAGWRQSQSGDIAAAFAVYEKALSIAPKENRELTYLAMFNLATMYIVHGDEALINKGLTLLDNIKKENKELLAKARLENNKESEAMNMSNILLADFNSGIAHTLHLYSYHKALEHFDRLIEQRQEYELEALSFASIAAAELNQPERVEKYLAQLGERKSADKVVEGYLTCYRDLAKRKFEINQSIQSCFNLDPNTTTEVTVDIYKRISSMQGSPEEVQGLREIYNLFVNTIEPELKKKSSLAASNVELKRLETETQLKSEILEKERALLTATASEKDTQQKLFVAIFLALLLFLALIFMQLRQKRKLAEQFKQMSLKDGLTKLGNRRYFEHNIVRELAYIKRHHKFDHTSMLGLYIFDIDHFKKINDRYGHDAGDAVLIEFSDRINLSIRETDLLIRWGGEEFVFVARVKTEQEILDLAKRLGDMIKSEPFEIPNHNPITVTCTIGVVKFPFFEDESLIVPWQQLVSLADMALYHGKQKRDGWVLIEPDKISHPDQVGMLLTKPLQEAVDEQLISIKTSFDQS